jgi:fibronectin-binding autotransporter adhesin
MFGLTSWLRLERRERTIGLGVAMTALLAWLLLFSPSAAHAAGCENSWSTAKSGSWFEGSNWSKGTVPTSEEEVCITENGTYTVEMTQKVTVTVKSLTIGGTAGTQTVAVGSSCSGSAVLTTTTGIGNGAQGAIVLTNGDGCGNGVTLVGPITNAGTITVEPEHGGARDLQGNLTNTGTLTINTNTAYNSSSRSLTNKGTLSVAEGKTLSVAAKNSVTNGTSGKIVTSGNGDVFVEKEASFTEGAGTTSGTKPVIIDDGALSYTGSGKSTIALHGESSTLSGNLSGSQSLSIESTCGEHAMTTAAASFTNAGVITLTNGDGCGNNATFEISAGTLTNSGKLITEAPIGGARTLQGNITNTGTLSINVNTAYSGSKDLLMNEGAIKLAEAVKLTASNEGSVTNGVGGSITATGSADVLMDPGTSFTEGAGTTSGTKPVIIDDGALDYTGSGASTIALHGESSTLSGNLSGPQSLSIESTCGEHAMTTAAASFTNAGVITLTNGDGCGNNATFEISAGTLTNSGKLITEAPIGGARTLQGNITNTGTLSIKANTAYNGLDAALIDEGALNIAEGTQLTVSNDGSVTNGVGGSITATGSADVFMDPGTSFTEGAGTTSGTKPVIVDDGALDYTGSGAGTIALHGTSTLSGNLGGEQVLLIESTCGEHAIATAAASFTNEGTMKLTNGDGCGNNATLEISAGTLTNSGKLITEAPIGGARTLQGNITNTGTLSIKANTAYNGGSSTLLTNKGALDLAEGDQLTVSGGSSVVNGSGGDIVASGSGTLSQSGGTFTEAAGKISGTTPVILDDGALVYTGTSVEHGSGPIALRGTSTLSGTVRSGELLSIQSTCSEHAVVTTSSFNNNGTLELTNGDGCGNNVTLNLKEGTLTNNGTLNVYEPHGGTRSIQGSVTNTAVVGLAAGETLQVSGNYVQTSTGRFKTFIVSESSFGAMSVAGSATIAGTLILRQTPPFKASLGQKYGILTSGSLTGTFTTESEDQINSTGLYYQPTYSATAVTLLVTQATLVLSSAEGAPGSTVTLSGGGYLPGDTITPTFTDKKGVSIVFPSVVANGSGEFSTEITIPPSAALGKGTIKTTSMQTGVHISQTYKVT